VTRYNPALTPNVVKSLLIPHVDNLSQWTGKVASGGRLNLLSSLLAVNDDVLPAVAIPATANNSAFVAPASMTIGAAASDVDGSIAKVDFYANGALIELPLSRGYCHIDLPRKTPVTLGPFR